MERSRSNKRIELAGDSRFLTFSCYHRLPLLRSDWAKNAVVEYLAHTKSRLDFRLYAFVAMPDHLHLLLRPNAEVANVRRIMSALKSRTATAVLERLKRESPSLAERARDAKGQYHLWQPGGGYDRNIHSHDEFLEKVKYIDENPVRRGLAERAEDYVWSSAGSAALVRDPWED